VAVDTQARLKTNGENALPAGGEVEAGSAILRFPGTISGATLTMSLAKTCKSAESVKVNKWEKQGKVA